VADQAVCDRESAADVRYSRGQHVTALSTPMLQPHVSGSEVTVSAASAPASPVQAAAPRFTG